jgi:transcriptional regulator GlxA family with amidase domain
MGRTTGILIFDEVEELDFAGPWEVFTAARHGHEADRVLTIAPTEGVVRCAKGLRVLPDCSFDDAPPLDVVVVPGGQGTRREAENPAFLDWLREAAARCTWVTSVCTGSLLLHAAGIAKGRRITTHWSFVEALRDRGDAAVVEDRRYVRDGNLVTAAGVSAGIDMALWVVGQIYGVDHARLIQKWIEYDPAPPYAADV